MAVFLTAVILLGSVLCVSAAADGEFAVNEVNRMNVMFAIDGSGSLMKDGSDSKASDVNGFCYEAIDLFLALLTNEGNQDF